MEKWRLIQKKGFNSTSAIADFLSLDENNRKFLIDRKEFPTHIPLRIAQKMAKNCINNPLALQFLPLKFELENGGGQDDPVGDVFSQKGKAILHKYQGRALLITTGACLMHCRYCFRQNFSYQTDLDEAILYISKDLSIKEVILSGGDPLSLSDNSLFEIFKKLETIEHLKIIRFHTRFLIGMPERVTSQFLSILKNCSKQIVFVLHVNSAMELDEEIFESLYKIKTLGISVLSQSVLLKGVNDTKEDLYALFFALSTKGVIPYYLHRFDKVKGGMHFDVCPKKGALLIKELRNCLPGYAVPRFVEEVKGEKSKTILF